MTTRGELFARSLAALRATSDEARLDATRILEHVLGIRAAELFAFDEIDVRDASIERVDALVERRMQGEPVAYLCNEAWFYGRAFYVDERVLVPRPETELLIEVALADLRARPDSRRVVDIGTGSGAIALTLAAEVGTASVSAVDISEDALTVARRNGRSSGLGASVSFIRSDLFADVDPKLRFDLIAANLPYLRSDEVPSRPDPLGFEPASALDGGDDGLDCYRRLFEQLPERSNPGAFVLLEAAPPTMPLLERLSHEAFPAADIRIEFDYGGSARILTLRFPHPRAQPD